MAASTTNKIYLLLAFVSTIAMATTICGCSSNSGGPGIVPAPTKKLCTQDIINQEVVVKPRE